MGKLLLISGIFGDFNDVSPRMKQSISICHILFVEEKEVYERFISGNNIECHAKVLEMHKDNSRYFPLIQKGLEKGMNIGVFESSGTPCFVDPGYDIVNFYYSLESHIESSLEYIPGTSAINIALSLSGFDIQNFYYGYFIRDQVESELKKFQDIPVIYFFNYSDHKDIATIFGAISQSDREMYVGINIGKNGFPFSETSMRGKVGTLIPKLESIIEQSVSMGISSDIIIIFDKYT